MQVLIGTTNPSKVKRFASLLRGHDFAFLTLEDLGIFGEPEESGQTPEENAVIKASYYGRFFDPVICGDSGLYFDQLAFEDPRQPGLKIRAPQGRRLDDEEMIAYYSQLIHSFGGRLLAYYLDGVAVYRGGKVFSFMEKEIAKKAGSFYLVEQASKSRHPGWPLDSLSVNKNTNSYFTDGENGKRDTLEEQIMLGEYRRELAAFLLKALGR